jgi:hypothetical protein
VPAPQKKCMSGWVRATSRSICSCTSTSCNMCAYVGRGGVGEGADGERVVAGRQEAAGGGLTGIDCWPHAAHSPAAAIQPRNAQPQAAQCERRHAFSPGPQAPPARPPGSMPATCCCCWC